MDGHQLHVRRCQVCCTELRQLMDQLLTLQVMHCQC